MRENLKAFISYEEGKQIRKQLHEIAKKEYEPKHLLDKYLLFMNNNECTFTIQYPQSQNCPWYFGLFTIVSQHVYGDCIEECLDKAITSKNKIEKNG